MTITMDKQDKIHNALIIGMALEDAYIFAGLTPQEIEAVSEDTELQLKWHRITKEFEYGLINRLNEISVKQAKVGRETATTWMLEHMFPRYSGKPMNDMPDIHLHIDGADPANYDTVKIMNAPTPTDPVTQQPMVTYGAGPVTSEPVIGAPVE